MIPYHKLPPPSIHPNGMTIVPPLIMKDHARFPAPRFALPEGEGQSPEKEGGRVSLREFHVKRIGHAFPA